MLPEQIKTIENFTSFALKEKGSEFISEVYPVLTEDAALAHLHSTRKKYFDATHHCFAYQLHSEISKYSDDGEPKGTAGARISNAINHFELTDLILIVTRYFGGTKLGVGPLGKAYYNSAIGVLERAKIVKLELYQQIEIIAGFNYISQVHHLIANHKAKIVNSEFTELAKFECYIKPSLVAELKLELSNISGGQIIVKLSENFTYEKFI
jgi:uncharacterized YigZ family protein